MLRMPAETPRSEGDAQPDRLTREPLADTEGHPEEPTEDLERVITETRARLEPGVGSQDKEPVGKPLDIDQLISVVRANLRPGGPPVDHPALIDYVAGVLVEDERRLVLERIITWRAWHEAWSDLPAADRAESGVQGLLTGWSSRLLPGGPPIDHPALYAYVAGVLAAEDRPLVAERIATWRDWFEAYIPIRAAADLK